MTPPLKIGNLQTTSPVLIVLIHQTVHNLYLSILFFRLVLGNHQGGQVRYYNPQPRLPDSLSHQL